MAFSMGEHETICALSTPPGVGGIAVIRVSGSKAGGITRQLCPFLPETPESHRIYYGLLRSVSHAKNTSNIDQNTPVSGANSDVNSGSNIDEVLVSFFREGRSFTGEETCEISCHGGSILQTSILQELVAAGCRMARPGEFTYRAFMSGRLDLVQAESILGLIESQSKQSARVALRQLQGHLSQDFARVEDDLLWILAQLEANIDFSAENLEVVSSDQLKSRSRELVAYVEKLMGTYRQGRLLREGLQIALVGKPNAGKSSLLNALVREERAIVTAEAGTTRDLVEGHLSFAGIPVTFVDTAGLRETANEAERIGIERTRKAMKNSDLVFVIVDLSNPEWRKQFAEFTAKDTPVTLYLFNKADLLNSESDLRQSSETAARDARVFDRTYWVSAKTRSGLSDIEQRVEGLVKQSSSESTNVVTQARHLEQLQKIQSCLVKAVDLINSDSSPEFIAFELQEAIRAIHELLGKEFHEQVIDRIFKEFCLGK
jgi:tRNA modification GTPase